jgi:hypothetical protein
LFCTTPVFLHRLVWPLFILFLIGMILHLSFLMLQYTICSHMFMNCCIVLIGKYLLQDFCDFLFMHSEIYFHNPFM